MKNLVKLLILLAMPCIAAAEGSIHNITFKGNDRITNETIYSYLEMSKNEGMNAEKVDQSIKNLYNTGFFEDVKISSGGAGFVVEVVENPMINKIAFEGNKKIEDTDLKNEISLKPRTVLSTSKLDSDIARIVGLYQKRGKYSASVEPKMIKLDQNRINLVFEIEEGTDAYIKKINFSGNENFSDTELTDVIFSKESRWYRFFSSVDVYDVDKMQFDKELLRRYYQNKGYADFAVVSSTAELTSEKDGFLITYVVHEGQEYNIGNIKIENNIQNFKPGGMEELVSFRQGSMFKREYIDDTVENITNFLGEHGYPFVDVEPVIVTHKSTKLADITFSIKESYRVYVNKINISKNTRTLDKVIRRELKISEGDPYNISKVQRSKQNIENLGYFSKVEFKNKKTENSDRMDLDVEVEEASTGSLNFGVGYNTVSGPLGRIGFSENNFLGKGQQVSGAFTVAKRDQDVLFSFTEPYFLDRKLAAGFDLFATSSDKKDEASYKSRTLGFALRMAYNLTEHLSHGFRYSLKKEDIRDVSSDASDYIKEQKGRTIVSSVGQTFVYDRLNSTIEPTDGFLFKIDQDLAGVGGDTKYIKHVGLATYYKSFFKKDYVFKLIGRAGNITAYGNQKVRLADRFNSTPDYIRGYEFMGIDPRDKKKGNSLGSNNFVASSAEFYFPLGLPEEVGMKGAVFFDAASYWGLDEKNKSNIYEDRDFRYSYGPSLIWKTPIGATVKLHYGIPLNKKSFDEERRIYLNFGANL